MLGMLLKLMGSSVACKNDASFTGVESIQWPTKHRMAGFLMLTLEKQGYGFLLNDVYAIIIRKF
jgi:hypothetical protein